MSRVTGRTPWATRTPRSALGVALMLATNAGEFGAQENSHVPFDFYMWGYEVLAVDGSGNEVPHAVIHHANILDPGHRELFLPPTRLPRG